MMSRIRRLLSFPNQWLQLKAIRPLVDDEFYYERYPDVRAAGISAALHYLNDGWEEGRDPNQWFSTAFYLDQHPDLTHNPLFHFVKHGSKIGLMPHSDFVEDEKSKLIIIPSLVNNGLDQFSIDLVASEISDEFYRHQLRQHRLRSRGVNFAQHYLTIGAALGLDPNEGFSTAGYWSLHQDVQNAKINPFLHYLTEGRKEGRRLENSRSNVSTSASDVAVRTIGDHFDADYYLRSYPDVARSTIDPLLHFVHTGWREGRNPSPSFSVLEYLEDNPDVAEAGVNPFFHYLSAGKMEGRAPRSLLGFRSQLLKSPIPLADQIASYKQRSLPSSNSASSFVQAVTSNRRGSGRLYISVSHDDYAENFGGVQLCLKIEALFCEQEAIDHLHLFPARSLPLLEFDPKQYLVGARLNGELVGFFEANNIKIAFSKIFSLAGIYPGGTFAGIHSLIGHNVASLSKVLSVVSIKKGVFWLHDYSSVCSSYTLLRNDVQFCGVPAADSLACEICKHGAYRLSQNADHQKFLKAFNFVPVAPSQTVADIVQGDLDRAIHVQPHCKLGAEETLLVDTSSRATRIAFLGSTVFHKGWWVFRELVLRFADDERYEFHHFGDSTESGLPVKFHHVRVENDIDAMKSAVQDAEIDIALIWSIWPETFCFTATEAIAAGAVIIAHADSGNVRNLIQDFDAGLILNTENELFDAFRCGTAVHSLSRSVRTAKRYNREFSSMSFEVLFS